ncbi:hypothetical protein BDP27DRAFT_1424195 [Rhodocollybia butyracea]|uniref:DUF6534 domain-containing protein n=1 Tax=Rhodocollybia butyracea TaxID=206335 RepID=A0A9P5U3U5_9AGAR|nr:hypothetical protein BDP27DRAFT_1424195 [Rhodocollybia butyracea]
MSTSTSSPCLALDLNEIYGSMYISTQIVSALWGISCIQIFTYFIHYPKDKAIFKILENIGHSIMSRSLCHSTRVFYPDHILGNPAVFEPRDPIETSVQSLMTPNASLHIAFIYVHNFSCIFASELSQTYSQIVTSRRLVFPIIFLPLIIGQLVVEAIAIHIIIINTHTKLPNQSQSTIMSLIQGPAVAFNALPVAIDAGLAACMTYWLYKESKGAVGSHAMIVRLITLTINSGFWTASVALAALVGSLVGSAQTFATIYYLLCPLYCNTVLANLNAREYIRDGQRSEIVLGSNLRFETAPRSTIAADASFAAPDHPTVHPLRENMSNRRVFVSILLLYMF